MFKKSASPTSAKIPMLIGILLLLAGVVGGVYLVQQRQSPIKTQADVGTAPMGVEISNINDASFVISWTTPQATEGFVSYGTQSEQMNNVARDKRDLLSSDYQQYLTHYVQVTGLAAGTDYFFRVNSGKTAYLNQENKAYQVKTAATKIASGLAAVSGRVQTADGGSAEGDVVLISGANLSLQSTMTNEKGEWVVNLENALSPNLDKSGLINPEDDMYIRAVAANGKSSAAILGKQINDIPTLIIGQVFDFRNLADSSAKGASKFTFIDDLAAQSSAERQSINIWNPQESEAINTTMPLFIGTAAANTEITLNLVQGKTEVSGTTKSDERGNWRWTSDEALALGAWVARASYTNDSGITFQAESRFTVLGNSSNAPAIESSPGGQLAQASPSPSVTPTIKLSPSVTGTPKLTVTATATPTTKVSPTARPTSVPTLTTTPSLTPTIKLSPSVTGTPKLTVTATATPTTKVSPTATIAMEATATPTPTKELPVASTTTPTYIAGVVMLILSGLGILLLN